MTTLDDIANNTEQEMETIEPIYEPVQEHSKVNEMFSRVLTAKTGEGTIVDYLEHPLNFNHSKGLARIIRGLTGIVGNLNLAIIDVALGGLEFSKERTKGAVHYDVSSGGGFPS